MTYNYNNFNYPGTINPPAPYNDPNHCPPRSGYVIISDSEMAKMSLGQTKQLFYARATLTALTPEPALFPLGNTKEIELVSQNIPLSAENMWIVTVNAIELQRTVVEFTPRSSLQTILSANFPRYSTLQAMIKWMDGSANSHIVKIDISGGSTFQVYGRNVQLFILAPPNTQIIEAPDQPGAELIGQIFNTVVSARIAPLLQGKGNLDIQKFTVLQGVLANATEFVEIPPGSRRVEVYNATVGTATTTMYFWMGDALVGGHVVGIIDFTSTNMTGIVSIPCGATHISTGPVNAATGRCFSFVFLIDP